MKTRNSLVVAMALLFVANLSLQAQNKYDSKGLRQGLWSKTDAQGKKIYQGTFKDGYEIGTFEYYFADGKTLKAKNEFSDKGHFACTTDFDTFGNVISKGFYIDKKKDSLWTFYNTKGIKIGEEHYIKGKKNGICNYFDKDNVLAESVTYKADKKDGVYFKNLYQRGYFYLTYKQDKKEGIYEEYYYYGKIREKGNFASDGREGKWLTFDSAGHTVKIQTWEKDKLTKEEVFLQLTSGQKYIETKDIAYFYPVAKRMDVILFSGEVISTLNNIDAFLDVVGLDDFIQLNKQANFFASLQAIKGIGDRVGEEYSIQLKPALKQKLLTDKDSRKALELMFKPQEELKKK
jgi:Uncharacterized protein conserved in bacteria